MFNMNDVPECSASMYEKINACKNIDCEDGWIDLACVWDDLISIGSKRDNQKSSYKSSKNWSRYSTHALGAIGEMCFSIVTGCIINADTLPEGDGNIDFIINGKSVDVKSTQYWRDPDLKQYPFPKKWADIYVLCGIDIDRKRAKIFGWASKDQVMSAKKTDYGYGEQFSIKHHELNKDISLIGSMILAK